MSPDGKYLSLILYATKLEIDLCNFPAIWAVLSILLDTISNKLQYVKNLQQVVNNYYETHPIEAMRRLEQQTSEILDVMYDSMTNQNFEFFEFFEFQMMLIEFQVQLIMILTR